MKMDDSKWYITAKKRSSKTICMKKIDEQDKVLIFYAVLAGARASEIAEIKSRIMAKN